MLLVQKYLQNHSLGQLIKDHGVYGSFNKSGQLCALNYDMIEAKDSDLLAQECRGLILATKDGKSFLSEAKEINGWLNYDDVVLGETKIINFPFRRFFNYGQNCSVNFNDPKLSVYEKLDGTLCSIVKNSLTNQFIVSTRSVPEADLLMDNGIFTFRTLFEKAVKETCNMSFDEFTSYLEPNHTYCFELTSPLNRIVCNYPDTKITLLMIRNLETLQELDLNHLIAQKVPVPIVKSYPFSSIDNLLDWVSSLNPLEHEGVVVKDSNFNRVKIKNIAYVSFNKLHDRLGNSERNCLEIVLTGREDDVMSFMPQEIADRLLAYREKLKAMLEYNDELFLSVKKEADVILPGDRKTFANLTPKERKVWDNYFFKRFDNKVENMRDFIQKTRKNGEYTNSTLDKVLDLLKNF